MNGTSLNFDEHLGLEFNARFGFSFLYPKTWDRRDSESSDGNIYIHPKDEHVEMRAWGGYGVVSPSVEEWVRWTLGHEAESAGYRLLMDRESGRHVHYFTENKGGVVESRDQIRGRRVVYEIHQNGSPITTMQAFTQFQDTQFAIRCQAPSPNFSRFEDLFITLGQSLRVLGEHPDRVPKKITN